MKRLLLLLVFVSSLLFGAFETSAEERKALYNWDDAAYDYICYEYEVVEDDIHYVYNLLYREYHNSICDKVYEDFTLVGMWHEPNVKIPEVVTIPEKVHIKFPICDLDFVADVKIESNCFPYAELSEYPDECVSFNIIRIPKGFKLNIDDGFSFINVLVKGFEIEDGNPYGNFSYNGIWMRKYTDYYGDYHCYVNKLPILTVLADWINYTPPDFVTEIRNDSPESLWRYKVVPFYNEIIPKINRFTFGSCPFYGVEIPAHLRDNGYTTQSGSKLKSNLRAFGSCNFELGEKLVAARISLELETVKFKDLYNIYNLSKAGSDLVYLEFSTTVLPEIQRPSDNVWLPEKSAKELANERKVLTYVRPELVEGFKELQAKKMFPVNAEIVPIEDKLYLYPELDHGRWSHGRTQMIYAVCRFGNSDISDIKWETNSEENGHIDQDGVLTVFKEGDITVTCTITDTDGVEYEASRYMFVTEAELTSVRDIPEVSGFMTSIPGVYNLHGIKVSDTPDNLPAGIYICDGKKIAVR